MYGSLMVDVNGLTLDSSDVNLLQEHEVGGLIIFARNVESPQQVRELCDAIRAVNKNIIIAVDQEGGRVARLRQGFTPLPAMGKLGKLFNSNPCEALQLAYYSGYLMASEVLAVGIDLSFAPVLDVNGISKVIGDRGFHQNPEGVVALSSQFMRGMKSAGMATTGKHFPGHGSVAPDSHVADAIDDREYDEIFNHDMKAFIQTMPWLDALMPAHVIFSKIDDKPAGFSQKWLQDIIRNTLKFNGVLFSDDLSMKAAHVAGGAGERVKAAIDAGCDMALVCNDRMAVNDALKMAKNLPLNTDSQQRLMAMVGKIPTWQGSLEQTCKQFDEWEESKSAVNKFLAD